MEIVKTSRELTPEEKYFLTLAPNAQKMKDAVSQRIEISAFCLYKDVNAKGEEQEILSIVTPEREVFATVSPTFKDDFFRMVDSFNDWGKPVNSFVVTSGTSKAGREFITCVYVD